MSTPLRSFGSLRVLTTLVLAAAPFAWTLSAASFAWSSEGTIAITFEPPTRIEFAAATALTWSRPLAYYKQTSTPQWSYQPGRRYKQGGFALDLLEAFN